LLRGRLGGAVDGALDTQHARLLVKGVGAGQKAGENVDDELEGNEERVALPEGRIHHLEESVVPPHDR
jgi:hypothetical protein